MTQRTCASYLFYLITAIILSACGGSEVANKTVTGADDPAAAIAAVNLISDNYTVEANENITLLWATTGVTECTASGFWSGDKALQGSEVVGPITEDVTLTINCTSAEGNISSTVNIAVNPTNNQAPLLTFNASSENIGYQGSSVLTWSSTNANNCSASGGWSGDKSTSGSLTLNSLTESSSYTLTCTGDGGEVSVTLNIDVLSSAPQIAISASPEFVVDDGSTILSWNATNANSCTASGAWSGNLATSGSRTISSIQQNSSYIVTCSGDGGSSSSSVVVSVMPTISLTASQTSVPSNGSTTLTWSSTNATSCEASGDWSGSKPTSGILTIDSIIADNVFNLSCSGAGGTANYSLNVSVIVNNNGTALLSWTPPTANTDESALTDLTGYKIHYGTSPGNYTEVITIDNPGLTSYLIEDLAANTWYFAMTAYNSSNIESAFSEEKSKTIN
jgi:hypothetical protein